jgi:2-dehydro-3-deoxyphosphogluconate aldolase/(4S)-4-hydroxy-2-oxoglutarate aldolase
MGDQKYMKINFPQDLVFQIEKCGIMAVVTIDDETQAVPLANALLSGGVNVMELTLRTPVAIAALQRISTNVPSMIVGVGTILTPNQVREAVNVGAAFGVSPGTNRRVLDAASEAKLPFAPGVATPSDIETAIEYGCKLLKFFPSEPCGGLLYLKTMIAPYIHLGIQFLPLGGITNENMHVYLADPAICAIGGSSLAPRDAITARDWTMITGLCKEARNIIRTIRGS